MGEFEEKYRFCTRVSIRKESVESVDDALRQTEFIGRVSNGILGFPQGGKKRRSKSVEEEIERDREKKYGANSRPPRLGAHPAPACGKTGLSGIGADFSSAVGQV